MGACAPADIDFVLDVNGINETGILMSVSDSHILDKMQACQPGEPANDIWMPYSRRSITDCAPAHTFGI